MAAPGRVNIIGEHIDYSNGFVLPMALDRYTVIAAGPAAGDQATLRSVLGADDETVISLAEPRRHPMPGHWSNYVAGVIAGYCSTRHALDRVSSDDRVGCAGRRRTFEQRRTWKLQPRRLCEAMTGESLEPVG